MIAQRWWMHFELIFQGGFFLHLLWLLALLLLPLLLATCSPWPWPMPSSTRFSTISSSQLQVQWHCLWTRSVLGHLCMKNGTLGVCFEKRDSLAFAGTLCPELTAP